MVGEGWVKHRGELEPQESWGITRMESPRKTTSSRSGSRDAASERDGDLDDCTKWRDGDLDECTKCRDGDLR